MDEISYEEMEKMYREACESNSQPDLAYTNLETLSRIYGNDQVQRWIEDGTIRTLTIDKYLEETSNATA